MDCLESAPVGHTFISESIPNSSVLMLTLFKVHNLKLKDLQGQAAPALRWMAFSLASIHERQHSPRLLKTAAQLRFLKDVLLTSRGIWVITLINNDSSHL